MRVPGLVTIRNFAGQERVLVLASRTGDCCESFSYYTRLDPFLPFLDAGYQKGGQAPLVPRLECVATRPGGGLRAYYGYNNSNGVIVNVRTAPTTNSRRTRATSVRTRSVRAITRTRSASTSTRARPKRALSGASPRVIQKCAQTLYASTSPLAIGKTNPGRCQMLWAVFNGGPVVEGSFPEALPTFF